MCALLIASPALRAETAYQALRLVGTERGADLLNHVRAVQGANGSPQPGVWRIVLDDPGARGGVREIDVAKGKIVAEHTPLQPAPGAVTNPTMDFHKLNLDSEGAFTVAEKEASKAHLGFDTVDYTLRSSEGNSTAPVWIVQLLDGNHHRLGSMRISAENGAVLRSDLYGRAAANGGNLPPPPSSTSTTITDEQIVTNPPPRVIVEDRTERTTREEDVTDDDSNPDDDAPGRLRVGHRINKALHEAGATLEEFFTGKRTIDQKYRDEDDR